MYLFLWQIQKHKLSVCFFLPVLCQLCRLHAPHLVGNCCLLIDCFITFISKKANAFCLICFGPVLEKLMSVWLEIQISTSNRWCCHHIRLFPSLLKHKLFNSVMLEACDIRSEWTSSSWILFLAKLIQPYYAHTAGLDTIELFHIW